MRTMRTTSGLSLDWLTVELRARSAGDVIKRAVAEPYEEVAEGGRSPIVSDAVRNSPRLTPFTPRSAEARPSSFKHLCLTPAVQ